GGRHPGWLPDRHHAMPRVVAEFLDPAAAQPPAEPAGDEPEDAARDTLAALRRRAPAESIAHRLPQAAEEPCRRPLDAHEPPGIVVAVAHDPAPVIPRLGDAAGRIRREVDAPVVRPHDWQDVAGVSIDLQDATLRVPLADQQAPRARIAPARREGVDPAVAEPDVPPVAIPEEPRAVVDGHGAVMLEDRVEVRR